MKFASAYELKKRLKFMGADFEGLQVKQAPPQQKGIDFIIEPLDTSALYDPSTGGFRDSIENRELLLRLDEIAGLLKDSNVAVAGLTPLTPTNRPVTISA
jgi:hypothetical protein